MLKWEVTKEESGTSLLAFLKQKLGEQYSARQIKKALDNNCCQINERTQRFGSTLLGHGDIVSFFGEESHSNRSFTFEQERVLYEDQDLLLYNKPPGVASDSPALLNALQRNASILILVHRLDRDTSGVLLFCKSKHLFNQFVELFKKLQIKKSYLAIVDGVPKQRSGVIDNYLGELHRYQGQALYGAVDATQGQRAITAWECEKAGKEASLLRFIPKTGRTHQIRVHCSEMGHPILGDYQYGRRYRCKYRPPRCLLHAAFLSFAHPTTGKIVEIAAPLPIDFNEAINAIFGI